jgi:LuxR family maltose regulon positive regulatory protein
MVHRRRLVDRISAGAHVEVVSITAPAGYGKTTLLGQVVDKSDLRVAWLTLDERCNDPAVLVTQLAGALDPVLHGEGQDASLLHASHGHERSGVLDMLVASVRSAPVPVLMVIDDVHLLQDPEGLKSVWTLLRGLPDRSLTLLAGQETPNLPLARQRASRELLEIGPRELAFDVAEARQLFDGLGVSASDDALMGLVERTGGWPAALHLATHSYSSDAVPRIALRSFGGGERLFASYVKSEVLDRLPEESQTFLVSTSVLDELTGPLCDHVLHRSGSARALVELDERYKLAVPLDRERLAYQYSPILRKALCHELSLRDEALAPIIHRRASQWYESQGDVGGAVRHAQAVNDVDRVASLLVAFGVREYARGRAADLRSWFEWLEQRRDFPKESAVVGAWLHLMSGRAAAAQLWAGYAEMAPLDAPMPDGCPCEGWLCTLRAALAVDVDVMKANSVRAVEKLSFTSPWRPTALSILGCAELWRGELEASEAHLTQAAEIGLSLGANAAAATALAARAELEIRRENWTRAQSLVNESVATVRRFQLASYVTSSLTFAIAGYCAARRGERAAATKYVELTQVALPETGMGPGLLGLQSRLSLVRIHLAMGEAGTAAATLKEIERLAQGGQNLGALTTEIGELASRLSSLDDEVPTNLRITPAEMRLLPLLASAYSLREIADQMYLSPHTVKSHAASIYRKLGVSSRAHAVERASELGLVSVHPRFSNYSLPEPRARDRSRARPATAL